MNNPLHVKQLQLRNKVNIYAPENSNKFKEEGIKKGELYERMVHLNEKDIEGCKLGNILDFNVELIPQLKHNELILDEWIALLPLLPLPIYTPNLYLLLTGVKQPAVLDSFLILKTYKICFKVLIQQPFFNSSSIISSAWIKKKIQDGNLSMEEFKEWLDHLIFIKLKKEEEEKQKNKNIPKKEELIESFEHVLKTKSKNSSFLTEEFLDMIEHVEFYPNCKKNGNIKEGINGGWKMILTNKFEIEKAIQEGKTNIQEKWMELTTVEDLVIDLMSLQRMALENFADKCSEILKSEDQLDVWTKDRENNFFTELSRLTITLIQFHEIILMRLLSVECISIPGLIGIPTNREIRGSISCKNLIAAPDSEIRDKKGRLQISPQIDPVLITTMNSERTKLHNLRNKNVLGIDITERQPYSVIGSSIQFFCLCKYAIKRIYLIDLFKGEEEEEKKEESMEIDSNSMEQEKNEKQKNDLPQSPPPSRPEKEEITPKQVIEMMKSMENDLKQLAIDNREYSKLQYQKSKENFYQPKSIVSKKKKKSNSSSSNQIQSSNNNNNNSISQNKKFKEQQEEKK